MIADYGVLTMNDSSTLVITVSTLHNFSLYCDLNCFIIIPQNSSLSFQSTLSLDSKGDLIIQNFGNLVFTIDKEVFVGPNVVIQSFNSIEFAQFDYNVIIPKLYLEGDLFTPMYFTALRLRINHFEWSRGTIMGNIHLLQSLAVNSEETYYKGYVYLLSVPIVESSFALVDHTSLQIPPQ
ncbi:hypothetical protein GEMRC1_006868 [Eukaryota sp. GEM-RC1]